MPPWPDRGRDSVCPGEGRSQAFFVTQPEPTMSLFAHYAGPARAGVAAQQFELLHSRYVAMPALLWGLAIVVALLVTAAQAVPARMARQGPATAEVCECTVYGA
jgi:hypothetical protein